MLSVHANAFYPRGVPADVRATPLIDAAAILRNDDSPAGRSRRRRAIARLGAYGFDGRGYPPPFDEALRVLGVHPERLAGTVGGLLRGKPSHDTVGDVETAIADLPAQQELTPECKWQKLMQWVTPPGLQPPPFVVAQMSIQVPRALPDVAAAMDPQSWDECSKYFCSPEHTFLASKTSSGGVVAQPKLPAGLPYGTFRTLFEHFRCNGMFCDADFQTLLTVNTWYDTPPPSSASPVPTLGTSQRYWVSYDLAEQRSGEILGTPQKIMYDQGWIWAEGDPKVASTVVFGSKLIQMDSPVAQALVHAALLFTELCAEQAEMACCPTPAPPSMCVSAGVP